MDPADWGGVRRIALHIHVTSEDLEARYTARGEN